MNLKCFLNKSLELVPIFFHFKGRFEAELKSSKKEELFFPKDFLWQLVGFDFYFIRIFYRKISAAQGSV